MYATSGTSSADGDSIGNHWKFAHLTDAFSTQRCDAVLGGRDSKARNGVTAVDRGGGEGGWERGGGALFFT